MRGRRGPGGRSYAAYSSRFALESERTARRPGANQHRFTKLSGDRQLAGGASQVEIGAGDLRGSPVPILTTLILHPCAAAELRRHAASLRVAGALPSILIS